MIHTMVLLNLLLYQQHSAIDTMIEYSSVFSLYKQNLATFSISISNSSHLRVEVWKRIRSSPCVNIES
ncbi:hypothetical protein ACHQM5_004046 [Ranunculus cassubicifolius]